MEILNIHTCRTVFLARGKSVDFHGYKVTSHTHAWNFLGHCENVIKNNMNADIYVIEMSTLKYKKGAHNFSKTEYENYLLDIFKLINKKPVFLSFNLNPVISPEHITSVIKSKLNNNNRIKSRDWSEKWTKQIFQKHHNGKFKALTGDDIFGKYNESKYISRPSRRMNCKEHGWDGISASSTKPRDNNYDEHAFTGVVDIRHYTDEPFDFLGNGRLVTPGNHATRMARRHLKDFIKQL